MDDLDYMKEAYKEALIAFDKGEYPVGAVLVRNGEIISRKSNTCKADSDPTAHAEILVIREACKALDRLSLHDCVLYTTLFPCPMCENTMIEIGIGKVVYGATSFKWIREFKYKELVPEITGPIMENECRGIFIKRLEERGRMDILDYEKSNS